VTDHVLMARHLAECGRENAENLRIRGKPLEARLRAVIYTGGQEI